MKSSKNREAKISKVGVAVALVLALTGLAGQLKAAGSSAWPNGYSYQRTITINPSQVPNTDQLNFPVLVSGTFPYLASTANGGNVSSVNGYDIVFTSDAAGSVPLPFERVSYNPATGAASFFVQVPDVSHTANTVIYMFYGNPSVTGDPSNMHGTWDSNFVMVSHMAAGSGTTAPDSTSYGNSGTLSGSSLPTWVTGKPDGGLNFGGSSSFVNANNPPNFNFSSNFTISAWMNSTTSGVQRDILAKTALSAWHPGGKQFLLDSNNNLTLDVWGVGLVRTTGTVSAGAWHQVTVSYQASTHAVQLYVDGSPAGNGTLALGPDNAGDVVLVGTQTNNENFWDGLLDEVEVSSSVRSSDWVSTAFNNQNSPSSFYTIGTAAVAPGYSYERAITISHLQVPNTDQMNFPVLITGTYPFLANTASGGMVINPNGYDIIFTSDAAGRMPLPFERVSYNASNGAVNFFVRVPDLSHTADTPIYMFFGNSSVTSDPSSAASTWDGNFVMVSHMAATSGTAVADSTVNGNNGTLAGSPLPSWTAGQPVGGLDFPGSNSYVNVSNPGTFNFANNFTISGWVNSLSSGVQRDILAKTALSTWHPGGKQFLLDSNNTLMLDVWGVGLVRTTITVSPGVWHQVAVSYQASNHAVQLYVDGALAGSGSLALGPDNSGDVLLMGTQTNAENFWNGILDEIEVSSSVRSSDWIATAFNNVNNPGAFFTLGMNSSTPPQQPTSVAPAITTAPASESVTFGQTATFFVAATGTAPLSYQWLLNGAPIGGATGSSYTTAATISANNGQQFSVTVSNGAGSITSSSANLSVAAATYANGYANEAMITINASQVPNTDQMNFPVLISGTFPYLATTANGGNVSSLNGYDIVFTSDAAGTMPLPFERASYNASTGAVNFFVQVPDVSHTANTSIYMFYGNPAVTNDPSNMHGTWDSNFAMVSHMAAGSGATAADSTSHANNGTLSGSALPTWAAGKPDGGLNFGGSNSYVSVSNPGNFNFANNFTISGWVNSTTAGLQRDILAKTALGTWHAGAKQFLLDSNNTLILDAWGVGTVRTTGTVSAGAWHHVAVSYQASGNAVQLYVDGAPAGSGTLALGADNSGDVLLMGTQTNAENFWDGMLDEMEVSSSVRSSDWIATTFNNQNNPSSFYGVTFLGGPQGIPGTSSVAPAISSAPASASVVAGQAATFFVAATGSAPLSYQWLMNGAAIGGATGSSYTTAATTTGNSGEKFSVAVSNGVGSVTSSAAVLTVTTSATGVLSASVTSLSLGAVNIGSSIAKTVTLTNTGNANVTISGVSLSGAGLTVSGVANGTILTPNQSATLTVLFAPASSGSMSGSVTVSSNASDSLLSIALSGSGTAATSYSVSLNWAVDSAASGGYNVYRGSSSGGPYTKLTGSPLSTNGYTDNNVSQSTTYYYVVTAVNSTGVESTDSNQATVTVP